MSSKVQVNENMFTGLNFYSSGYTSTINSQQFQINAYSLTRAIETLRAKVKYVSRIREDVDKLHDRIY